VGILESSEGNRKRQVDLNRERFIEMRGWSGVWGEN